MRNPKQRISLKILELFKFILKYSRFCSNSFIHLIIMEKVDLKGKPTSKHTLNLDFNIPRCLNHKLKVCKFVCLENKCVDDSLYCESCVIENRHFNHPNKESSQKYLRTLYDQIFELPYSNEPNTEKVTKENKENKPYIKLFKHHEKMIGNLISDKFEILMNKLQHNPKPKEWSNLQKIFVEFLSVKNIENKHKLFIPLRSSDQKDLVEEYLQNFELEVSKYIQEKLSQLEINLGFSNNQSQKDSRINVNNQNIETKNGNILYIFL